MKTTTYKAVFGDMTTTAHRYIGLYNCTQHEHNNTMKPTTKTTGMKRAGCVLRHEGTDMGNHNKTHQSTKPWFAILSLSHLFMFSQVNTPGFVINFTGSDGDENALVDVDATGAPGYGKMGLLIPRVSLASPTDQDFGLSNADPLPTSLLVYNTGGALPPGFYYWDGSKWTPFLTANNFPAFNCTSNNYVLKRDATGNISCGIIYDDGSNVGIGTSTPSAKLHLKTNDTTTVPFKIEALVSQGWLYRKQINIAGSPGAGTNYQVLLKVGESAGSTGADFHLEGHSANFPSGKNDGGDLRFTAADGVTLLDFWVENVFGAPPNRVAYIWVKVSADLGTNQSIYCYYGNPSATNVSNGESTFLFFDDFSGTNLDGTKWTGGYAGYPPAAWSVANDVLNIWSTSGNWQALHSNFVVKVTDKVAVEQKFYIEGTNQEQHFLYFVSNDNADNQRFGIQEDGIVTAGNNVRVQYLVSGGGFIYSGSLYNVGNNWYIAQVIKSDNYTFTGKILNLNRNQLGSSFSTTQTAWTINWWVPNYWVTTSSKIVVDWILVRKFVSPEPAFSSAGPEEVLSPTNQQVVLYIQNKTGNVGVWTTSPGVTFQVGNAGDGTTARANAWNTFSDIRLKKNIVRISGALDIVSQINGVYYYWKDGVDRRRQVGVIAQEVEKVLPEVVSQDSTGIKSVDYGKLTPLLIEAIKEQQKMIIEQRKMISEQQKMINEQQKIIEVLKLDNAMLKSDNALLKSEIERIKRMLEAEAKR